MRRAPVVILADDERETLLRWIGSPSTPQKRALRARIVLAAARGLSNAAIARQLGCSRPTVGHWRAAFAARGVAGLQDAPRPGRPPRYGAAKVSEILSATLRPPEAATHWSAWRLAPHVWVSHVAVHRVWRAHQLQPHRVETFQFSRDPDLVAKVCDIVGLYLDPPAKALVLCVDEKPQVQARERTRPRLPVRPGTPATQTHDYTRNGTLGLFAALVAATGAVVGQFHPRYRHQGFLAFRRALFPPLPTAGAAPGPGQPQRPQDPRSATLAEAASPGALPFHADERLLEESGRNLVQHPDPAAGAPGQLPERG